MEFVGALLVVCFRDSPMTSCRIDKRMFTPSKVPNWMIVIYERQQRFNEATAHQMANELVKACETVGTITFCRLSGPSCSPK